MNNDLLFEEALSLKEQIDYHNDLFFNQDTSEISDSEFDLLKLKYDLIMAENSDFTDRMTALEEEKGVTVYENKKALTTINHNRPFHSPQRTYDFSSFPELKKEFDNDIYIETKLDGLGIEVIYHHGELVHIVTKGSAEQGEDITFNLSLFKVLPTSVPALKDIPISDIRFEAHLNYDDIKDIELRQRKKIGKQRNQLSGWVRSSTGVKIVQDCVNLAAYDLDEQSCTTLKITTGKQLRKWFTDNGFIIPRLVSETELLEQFRNKLEPFDGYMVKANQFSTRVKLANTNGGVKAFKYNTLFGITTMVGIDWKTNKTEITPTLIYAPVNIDGSQCTNANGFNAGKIKELNLGVGDKIRVVMSGDIVPHLDVILEQSNSPRFKIPDECPCCKGPVSLIGPTLVCNNRGGCTDKYIANLVRATGNQGLDLKGIGESVLREWVGEGLIKEPADLFKLSPSDISAKKYAIISNGRKQPLSRFIFSLGIEDVGVGTSQELSKLAGNIEGFLSLIDDHEKIKANFGPSTAMYLLEAFTDKEFNHYIKCFANALIIRPDALTKELPRVVLTGSFELPRNVFAELLLKVGIEVVRQVTKDIKCVITGYYPEETNSMKVAKKYGIPVYEFDSNTNINSIIGKINNV